MASQVEAIVMSTYAACTEPDTQGNGLPFTAQAEFYYHYSIINILLLYSAGETMLYQIHRCNELQIYIAITLDDIMQKRFGQKFLFYSILSGSVQFCSVGVSG